MTIQRCPHDQKNPFLVISRKTVQNPELSWDALGLLVYLLSLPDDWKISVKNLAGLRNGKAEKIRRLLSELIEAGHCSYQQPRNTDGKMAEGNYFISEDARFKKNVPHTEKPDAVPPDAVNRTVHNREYTYKRRTTTGSGQKAYSKKASEKSVVVSFANKNLKKERPTYATISADEKVKVDACLEKAKLKNPISNEGGWKQKCIDEGWHLQTPDNPQENVRVNKELAEKIEREFVPHPMQSVHATPKNLIIIKHSKSYEVPYEEEPQSFVERIKRLLPNLKTSLVVEQVGNHLC